MSGFLSARRRGGALFPVLIISGLLLMLSMMLPQVLVQSSKAMKNDVSRDHLLNAAESGIAMAEARLKRQLANDLLAGAPVEREPWTLKPTSDNPDFGRKQAIDFEVKLVSVKPRDVALQEGKELHRFGYRLYAHAWNTANARRIELGVDGLMTLELNVDTGGSGIAAKSLGDTTIHAINRELGN